MEIMEAKQPGFLYEKLKSRMDTIGLSFNKLSFKTEIIAGHFSAWKTGARRPSDTEIEKVASVPELGILKEELEAWRIIEIYGIEALKAAIAQVREEDPGRIQRAEQAYKEAFGS